AMGFVTVAIPLQLEKEWVTIGWALQGLALTALWVRLDHPGLKYFGLALLAGATARLLNPAVLGYYPRPAFRIVNWLMYTYLVPAAALLATAALLEPREAARARPWERERWYAGGVADRRHRVRRGRPGRDLRVDQPRHRRLVHLRPRPPPELRAAARARSHDLARLGDLRARPARRRHGAGPDRAPLGEPRPPDDHDREGLPARPRRAPRSLPRGVAARARGLAHRGVARLSALRFPRRGGGADVTRLAVALGTLLALAAHAADPGEVDLRRLFPRQAEVYVTPPGGLSELRLPAEVLAACRPDLSDLRLFDRRGLEIPYVIDAGPEARTRAEVADRVEAQILEARREEIGRADAPALRREAYVVVAPTRTTEVGTWDLVMETDRPRFVRRVDVRAEAADGTGVQVLENASVFRLGAQRDKTRLPLPPLSGARLTVTVEGEEDFYLEPRLFFEGAHVLAARAEAAVDLAEVARQDADGRTVLELARPRYDRARLLGPAGARAGAALRDAARSARLGAVGPNPIFDGAPALGFAMRAGAEVDTRLYARRRRITVAPSPDGLSRLSLTAEDVAHARPDLADVRVVDAASRQWPYLLDRDGVERWERVSVEAPI